MLLLLQLLPSNTTREENMPHERVSESSPRCPSDGRGGGRGGGAQDSQSARGMPGDVTWPPPPSTWASCVGSTTWRGI
ncbi:unnamed protein product [Lampetra fluviatilis]